MPAAVPSRRLCAAGGRAPGAASTACPFRRQPRRCVGAERPARPPLGPQARSSGALLVSRTAAGVRGAARKSRRREGARGLPQAPDPRRVRHVRDCLAASDPGPGELRVGSQQGSDARRGSVSCPRSPAPGARWRRPPGGSPSGDPSPGEHRGARGDGAEAEVLEEGGGQCEEGRLVFHGEWNRAVGEWHADGQRRGSGRGGISALLRANGPAGGTPVAAFSFHSSMRASCPPDAATEPPGERRARDGRRCPAPTRSFWAGGHGVTGLTSRLSLFPQ